MLKFTSFLGSILYFKYKENAIFVFEKLLFIHKVLKRRKHSVIHVPESFIRLLVGPDTGCFVSNTFLIPDSDLSEGVTDKLFSVHFSRGSHYSTARPIKFIINPNIPKQSICCCDELYFNIKSALGLPPYSPNVCIDMEINKCETDNTIEPVSKLVISYLFEQNMIDQQILNSLIQNYIAEPRLMCVGDVLKIDLRDYLLDKQDRVVYFKVVELKGKEDEKVLETGMVSQESAVYRVSDIKSFKPSNDFILMNNTNILSIISNLPLGMANYFCTLIKWFQPFCYKYPSGWLYLIFYACF
jgi:hypothetical protein